MFSKFGRSALAGLAFALLNGCSPTSATSPATPTFTPALTPYQTATPTLAIAAETQAGEPTSIPLPSPTPFLYTITENDTLIGIATRFDITLDDLLAANPNVDPQFLIVGETLVIPLGEGSIVALPSPTPAQVSLGQPDCYPTTDGGLWCFLLIENTLNSPLENLSAFIHLSQGGNIIATLEAIAPLNLLPPGQRLPLVAFFTPPAPAWDSASAQLLSALEVASDSPRYLAGLIEELQTGIATNGLQAQLYGNVKLADGSATASTIWLLAVAYDIEGNVVGVRRWENETPLGPGESLPFSIQVYSLAAPIVSLDLLLEARP